ncbi:MAG: endonuclease/exonuclease/phosphatase family protein, partial [Candidatus Sericytochromatia bacterium]
PVDVFVTHLSHLDPPNPVREAQAAELAGWLGQSRHPWILLGDFNATPDSAEIQLIEKLAHPLFRSQPKLLQINSFPAIKPTRRIDYIFFSSEFSLKKMNVLDNGGTTDHRPVYAELELKKK